MEVELPEWCMLLSVNCGHNRLLNIEKIESVDGVVAVRKIGSYGSEALVIIDAERQQEIWQELSSDKYSRPLG